MNDTKISELIDHERWLLNNGLVNDLAKNNLYMYGSIVHKDVQAVELAIDVTKKVVAYNIYVHSSLLSKISKYESLKNADDIISLWRLKRLLKKEGNLNLKHLLNSFVKDFCGRQWSATLNLVDYKNYREGFEELESETGIINTGNSKNFCFADRSRQNRT